MGFARAAGREEDLTFEEMKTKNLILKKELEGPRVTAGVDETQQIH